MTNSKRCDVPSFPVGFVFFCSCCCCVCVCVCVCVSPVISGNRPLSARGTFVALVMWGGGGIMTLH